MTDRVSPTLGGMSTSTPGPAEPTGSGPSPDASAEDAALELARSLFDACRRGDAAAVLPYLDAGAPASMRDSSGNSLLMLASYHGHAELTAALAARGADVDAVNDRGQTPLAGAAFKGYDEVARALLAAGADPELGTPSARDTALYFGRTEISALLPEA